MTILRRQVRVIHAATMGSIIALVASAVLSGGTAVSAQTGSASADPILGDWSVNQGAPSEMVTISASDGSFVMAAKTPAHVMGSSCDLPPGTTIATFTGSAPSYSGQHGLWHTGDCSFGAFTPITFTLSGDTLTGVEPDFGPTTLTFTRVPTGTSSTSTTTVHATTTTTLGTSSRPAVVSVSNKISPQTPLWYLDVNVELANLVCPANVQVTLNGDTQHAQPCGSVPGGGLSQQFTLHFLFKVFRDYTHYLLPDSDEPISVVVGGPSPLTYSGVVRVPKAPLWIGLGDSVSSALHQDSDNPSCVPTFRCTPSDLNFNDSSFSWASRGPARLNTLFNVPAQWEMTSRVLAQSGTNARDLPKVDGGGGQLVAMTEDLDSQPDSWNVVSVTGGAADSMFGDPGALRNYYLHFLFDPQPVPWQASGASDPRTGYQNVCPDGQLVWDQLHAVGAEITSGLQFVATRAATASPGARVLFGIYPYVHNSDDECFKDSNGGHGSGSDIDYLAGLIKGVTGPNVQFIDLRGEPTGNIPGFGTHPLQYLQLTRLYGYPHPNSAGQELFAFSAAKVLYDASCARHPDADPCPPAVLGSPSLFSLGDFISGLVAGVQGAANRAAQTALDSAASAKADAEKLVQAALARAEHSQ